MARAPHFPDHEMVTFIADPTVGLNAIIAVHSTVRGPAAGGLRMRSYRSQDEAVEDVLRLSEGMTHKNAAADLPLGGGKSVIIGDPAKDKTEPLLEAFGKALERLSGTYYVAEDMGMTPADMAVIARRSRFVAGLSEGEHASGDPSPVTADALVAGMRAAMRHVFGKDALAGRTVAVQGLGHVGWHACTLMRDAGASLVVTDVDPALCERARTQLDARVVGAQEIYDVEADVFAPCAIGAILNPDTIPRLRVRLIAGAANNQLATPDDAQRIAERGILYIPDFVINGGGIINVAAEILKVSPREPWVQEKVGGLVRTIDELIRRAREENVLPSQSAAEIVEARLSGG